MRRKDREVTDPVIIADIISRCTCCRIGFNDDGEVYIIPLSFGYTIKDDTYTFYFHGAKAGKKTELIRNAPKVGFEMDTANEVYSSTDSELACSYTTSFQSIIGNGVMSMVTGAEEKKLGLSLLMEHNAGKREWKFDDKMINGVAVFKLEVTKLSCKVHQ